MKQTFAALVSLASLVRADTITWRNAGSDWHDPANWNTDTIPGPSDIAVFPSVNPVVAPVISGTASVLGLDIRDNYSSDWSFSGTGSLTIGTSGLKLIGSNNTTKMNIDVVIDGDQTWESPGTSRYLHLMLTKSLSGHGNLTVRQTGTDGYTFILYLGDGLTPHLASDFDLDGSILLEGLAELQYCLGPQVTSGDIVLGGTAAAPQTISVTNGFARVNVVATNSTAGTSLRVVNPIDVGPDGMTLKATYYDNTTAIDFSGDVSLGGPVGLFRSNKSPAPTYSGVWTLPQDRGATSAIVIAQPGYDQPSYTFGASLVDGDGTFANPLCIASLQGPLTLSTPAATSTYAHGTVIDQCGTSYKDANWQARVVVDAASRLGTGDATVLPGGRLVLGADTALESGRSIAVQSSTVSLGVAATTYATLPPVTSDSHGVFVFSGTIADAIDQSAIGDGLSFLGTCISNATLNSASILPCSDGVWRLGAGSPGTGVLSVNKAALTGTNSLQVGAAKWNGNGIVALKAANTFSGRIDVTGITLFDREPDPPNYNGLGAQLQTQSLANGVPALGSVSAPLFLHNSMLKFSQSTANVTTRLRDTLQFEGRSTIYLDCNLNPAPLTFGRLQRENRGALQLYNGRVKQGTYEKLFVETLPDMPNGIVPVWFVDNRNAKFLTYDAEKGFIAFDPTETSLASATANSVVASAAATLSADATCYALLNSGELKGTSKISIGEGGLFMKANINNPLDFGSHEALIYSSAKPEAKGVITAHDGLTLCGGRLITKQDNDIQGQITVNGASLYAKVDTEDAVHALGPVTNPILLNGGALVKADGDRLLADRTITLGTSGGQFGGNTFLVQAKVTGPGPLFIGAGTYGGEVILDSPENDYEGGTFLATSGGDRSDGKLRATATGRLGTGDLSVNSWLTATLEGNANLAPSATAQVALGGTLAFTADAPVVGGLIGSGNVVLGTSAQSTELAIGASGVSSTFYGRIRETSASFPGALRKIGAGTFTLHGGHAFTGATTVEDGALVLRGSLAGDLDVTANGTLRTIADADGATHPGHVAGDLTIAGTVAVDLPAGIQAVPGSSYAIATVDGAIDTSLATAPVGFHLVTRDGTLYATCVGAATVIVIQ